METSTRTYRKVARAEQQERTRRALLDAADEAFMSGPWEAVSLEELAASAGVTKQTLLRHFGSRDGLIEQTLLRAMEEVTEQRMRAPRDDIAGAVENLLDHYEQRGGRAMRSSNLDGGGAVMEIGRRAREFHYEWVDHAFGNWLDRLPARERKRARSALIAVCDVHTWWTLSHDLGLSKADVRATLLLMIRRTLGDEQ